MGTTQGQRDPTEEYAAGLRAAVAGFLRAGGTQREIARALAVAPATLSRYLSGERLASRAVLDTLVDFLRTQGRTVDEATTARLRDLCRRAHRSSGSPAVRLAEVKGEMAMLRREHARALETSADRIAVLEERAGHLSGELAEVLSRARTAEEAVELHQAHVLEQDDQLRNSQEYTRRIEAELAREREGNGRLQEEVEVLREQNRLLVDLAGVPGPSLQAGPPGVDDGAAGNAPGAEMPSDLVLVLRLLRGRGVDGLRTEAGPLRDGIAIAAYMVQICLVGAVFSACLRSADRPAEWILLLFAVSGFVYALACGARAYRRTTPYTRAGVTWPATLVGLATCAAVPAGVAVPALLDVDVPGRWIAQAVGLL
ncbi:helix-turn-helix domain-containing protein [Streptomyces sp. NBC_00162]|uniref:helix-turn-helix domain-containing protein n=1 Tax=Streptomyces sp. NBC_00162 TaxID=2903629 RepID=UPI00214D0C49|nr:helix-turn-helix domain-containing protein [Streptomyces sp. NBC_00162]UUU43876.1 helix-turn-helix domain-containing protein [Streptomyces sp. NBC_00162]